jgi:hypothetical protein
MSEFSDRNAETGQPLFSASQRVARYSAARDIAAKVTSEPTTGTKLDITATDQMRPSATTATVIRTIQARICIPSVSC